MDQKPVKNTAMMAIKEARSLTGMMRGLMALEDEIGDLANLEKARNARQAELARVEGETKQATAALDAARAEVAKAKEEAAKVASAAKSDAEKVLAAASAAKDRLLAEAKEIRDEAVALKADADAFMEKARQETAREAERRDHVRREAEAEEGRLAAARAEMAALRDRMKV